MDPRSTLLAVANALPAELDVVRIDFLDEPGRLRVRVWTTQPALVLGRRGDTAERIRTASAVALGTAVTLEVHPADQV